VGDELGRKFKTLQVSPIYRKIDICHGRDYYLTRRQKMSSRHMCESRFSEMRTITTLLLIAFVLICPYYCMGGTASRVCALQDSASCICTGQVGIEDSCQSNDQTPDMPAEGQPDCLCHGAIAVGLRATQVDFDMPLALSNWNLDLLASFSSCSAGSPSLAALTFELPHQFPPFSTGRDVCELKCVFLL